MSSVDQQLQSATMRWQNCVSSSPDGDTDVHHGTGQGPLPACYGQATGTFEAELTGNTFSNLNLVPGRCELSAADEQTLLALHTTQVPGAGPGGPARPGVPDMPSYTRTLASLDGDYRLTKIQISSSEILVTGLPLATVQDTLNDAANTEHVVFATVLLLAVILGAGLIQFSLRPLRRVAATATKVTELPLDSGEVTLPAGVPDSDPRTEVGRVGAAFNRMLFHVERALGRRAASEARLRRFAADASHELRTPLSAIRGYAELALRHPGPVPDDVTHALRRVESESARMTVLVDDLLLLARLDAGRPLAREPVDVTRLAIDVTSDARAAAPGHRWLLELPDEPVMVPGDEHRLHQVLANLLSNAAKHTPPGSTVTTSLTTASADGAGIVTLEVDDDGPGIPPDLLPTLFERFVRGDSAR